jgi:hypothetical protein
MSPLLTSNGSATLSTASGATNGAWYIRLDGTTISRVGAGGGVPSGANGVRVNATKAVPTYFARVVGLTSITVKATGEALWGAASHVYLDSSKTGVMVMPLALDVDAFNNAFTLCGSSYGTPFNFSLYIDTPTDCALGTHDTHFSFTTLNIGDDCSNATVKDVLDQTLDSPRTLGMTYIEPGVTPIRICHGTRNSSWDRIPLNQPFLVPLISHTAAAACDPQCSTPVVRFAYMMKTGMAGSGSNQYLIGNWVDPATQPPLKGTGVSTTSSSTNGPVSWTLTR